MFRQSSLNCANKLKVFDDAVARHQHSAIARDLEELLSDSPSVSRSDSPFSPISSVSEMSRDSGVTSFESQFLVKQDDRFVCQVQFRHVFRHCRLPVALNVRVGEFVIIKSFLDESHEDLGVVTAVYSPAAFKSYCQRVGPSEDADENTVGEILRLALPEERKLLPVKFQREHPLLRICQAFVDKILLPMTVYGVDFQFDGNVLFVYYVSKDRVDFRPLVRFLARKYCRGVRIQMKKTNQCREFIPFRFASESLISGKYFGI